MLIYITLQSNAKRGKESVFDLSLKFPDFVWPEIVSQMLFLKLYSMKENSNVVGLYYFVYLK